jgi:ATP synthase protein I
MSIDHPGNNQTSADFIDQIQKKEKLKLSASRETAGSIWSGLGMFGMVGWSVAVPTLLGAALGIWLDKRKHHPAFSWTLTLLMAGLVTGSVIAWYWISREDKQMHDKNQDNDE